MAGLPIPGLNSTTQCNGGDQFILYAFSNNRAYQIAASDVATYMQSVFGIASVQFKASTNVITITLNNGQVITGTVVP